MRWLSGEIVEDIASSLESKKIGKGTVSFNIALLEMLFKRNKFQVRMKFNPNLRIVQYFYLFRWEAK